MKEPQRRELFDENEPNLSHDHSRVLRAPIELLEAATGDIMDRWIELYRSTFGRRAFFSPDHPATPSPHSSLRPEKG